MVSEVEEERQGRNGFYLGPETPFSPEARARFSGLKWWPERRPFRIANVKLVRPGKPTRANLGASGAEGIDMMVAGVFSFELLGIPCTLTAFEPAPGESDEDYILVPFRDETTGKETYGAGRYIDVEPVVGDVYTLDFNRAYHPYCAYDDAWSCTIPPPENRLAVRVEAGERL